ncbi:MAG TPA: CAP domain-containing protein [Solirubrobacterales bacterium]|nr:CAP domain-containing protein [Solirubrobacterales bacterium]
MARKLSPIVVALFLVGLTVAPAASAIGVRAAQAVDSRAAASSSSPIAPPSVCPDQEDLGAPAGVQEQAMSCMVDFARRQAGLSELLDAPALAQSAEDKSLDVLRCDEFSHFACGRDFTFWMKETGYTSAPCWRVGENLAWGTGEYGSVRSIFIAWMRSSGHRANILGDFTESGLSLHVGTLEGQAGTRIWAEHFGSHCE